MAKHEMDRPVDEMTTDRERKALMVKKATPARWQKREVAGISNKACYKTR